MLPHARAGTVRIELRRDPLGLDIEVVDDGVGHPGAAAEGTGDGTADTAAAPGTGNGLRGMRERAAALGGQLTAEPALPHGWQVRARLPAVTEAPA